MAVTTEKNGQTVDNSDDEVSSSPVANRVDRARPSARPSGGFFSVYKKGQGYWTRMGTAMGVALIIIVTALFAHSQAATYAGANKWVPIAVTGAVVLAGFIVAWLLMNKPRNVDFLIATDAEMKKVNWTSREELLGSTKIVIIFMFLLAAILFLIDIVTTGIFQLIGLLKFGLFG